MTAPRSIVSVGLVFFLRAMADILQAAVFPVGITINLSVSDRALRERSGEIVIAPMHLISIATAPGLALFTKHSWLLAAKWRNDFTA